MRRFLAKRASTALLFVILVSFGPVLPIQAEDYEDMAPSMLPSASPSYVPVMTFSPTASTKTTTSPTKMPVHPMTDSPTEESDDEPTRKPAEEPTHEPTRKPAAAEPTHRPTRKPAAAEPTHRPTRKPEPTHKPTHKPTRKPSPRTDKPTHKPTHKPTPKPTRKPNRKPTSTPTETLAPTSAPTPSPTSSPTTTDENRSDKKYLVPQDGVLLVSNTRGKEAIVQFNVTTAMFSTFIPASAGIHNPDHMMYDTETGDLYISHGDTVATSAIAKLDAKGTLDPMFATGGGLTRPYGFAMDYSSGILYVASFRTDQILMYNGATGDYLDVFAAGNATDAGLCNGPNHMVIYNGTTLYVTTQGTYIEFGEDEREEDELQYGLASQVIMYDLASGEGSVFAKQPELLSATQGYVSFLGLYIQCKEEEMDCTLFTTDFGGGLRAYSLTSGELVYASETTYEDDVGKSSTGALAYVPMTDMFYIPSFINETHGATLLAFNATTGSPSTNASQAILIQDDDYLSRPIGIIFIPPVTVTDDGTSTTTESSVSEESLGNGQNDAAPTGTTDGSVASSGSVLYDHQGITLLCGIVSAYMMMM